MNTGSPVLEINEVGPRDGLQIEARMVPTEDKIAFIDALSDCGFARLEVTSFTSPKAIPALADAGAVMQGIRRRPGVIYTALVPNIRGLERALEAGVDEMNLVMSCSETHNRANLRMTRQQSFDELSQVLAAAGRAGAPCNVSLSTAFGCPFDGDVPAGQVLDLAARLVDAGARGITLCDTTGMAYPSQVGELCAQAAQRLPGTALTVHLHNTRGMALANAVTAWQAGITRFDAAAGGLGGCPYAPGASGNVNTEELVHMFECMGVRTGVSLKRCSPSCADCRGWSAATCPWRCCAPGRAWPRIRRPRGWRSGSGRPAAPHRFLLHTTRLGRFIQKQQGDNRMTAFRSIPVLRACAIALGLAAAGAAHAQADFPNRPVTLIVSAAPGGTTDIAARLIAQPLGAALGQSVVVENKPGASGGIAAQAVARAKPDGYTLLLQYSGFQVITPHVTPTSGWDPIKDFAPVANVLSAPQVVVVRPDLPIKSLKDLVAYAKANPGKLNHASSGNGSLQQVATELLNQMAGTQITHIPYKGTGPALNDLLGGAVDMTITTPPPLLGQIAAGKLRALAVTGNTRLASLPDVPTAAEAGYPGLIVSSWFAMYAPKDTPAPVVEKIAGEIQKIMQTDAFRQKAAEQGAEAEFMGPKALGDYTQAELDRWGKVVKAAGITAN